MSTPILLEAGVYGAVALGSFYKLDNLETNAHHRPNSIVAFGLIIAWLMTGIAALSLFLLAMYHEAPTAAGWWVIFLAVVLTLLTQAAKVGGLLNGTCGESNDKPNAESAVHVVAGAGIAYADDDDVLAGEVADRIREREFNAMRPVGSDTDEYSVPVDDGPAASDGDGNSLPDVLPVRRLGDEPK